MTLLATARPRRLRRLALAAALLAAVAAPSLHALEKPGVTYPVFQFPADKIPRIDGDTSDWAMVPDSYVIGTDQLHDDTGRHPAPDPRTLDVKVRVGWVKGLNRLYFLYEAYDDDWEFSRPDLRSDIFEVVVDGDASGGPLIDKTEGKFWTPAHVGESAAQPDDRISADAAHWAIHGVQAQNYHIFTPPGDRDWCLAWGSPTWIKQFPWANAAYRYDFKSGQPGHLVLEFWITPFDYAGPEGPSRAVPSELIENKIIGLAWAVIDTDRNTRGFWNLSPKHTMFGDASELCAFRLMPLEPALKPALSANWSWQVVDMDRRLVAFKDQTVGTVTAWHWDFGDGSSSESQNPEHSYAKPGNYIVILDVTGPAGHSRRAKIWDVQLR